MNTVYIALIADIKESRCLENRFEIQMKMKRILEKINPTATQMAMIMASVK